MVNHWWVGGRGRDWVTRQIGHVVPSFPLEAVLEEGATNGDCKAEFRQSTEREESGGEVTYLSLIHI